MSDSGSPPRALSFGTVSLASVSVALTVGVVFLGVLLGVLPDVGTAEAANWRNLTGRVAPDLTFSGAVQGIAPNTKLSSFRGKKVVLLVFWLRDCPHCKREMPKVQRLYTLYGDGGLEVISIVHKFTPAQVRSLMQKRGWTFPVAQDATGKLAAPYGGGRRPGYFVVGIDGRVKSSNALNERVIQAELGRWRTHELGAMPSALSAARDLVYSGRYGSALRAAEAVARQPKATAEVQAAVERLTGIAGRKLQQRVDKANALARQGQRGRAAEEYRAIVKTFERTSLEVRAKALRDTFLAAGNR